MDLKIYLKHSYLAEYVKYKVPFCILALVLFSLCIAPKNSRYCENLPRDTGINTRVYRLKGGFDAPIRDYEKAGSLNSLISEQIHSQSCKGKGMARPSFTF